MQSRTLLNTRFILRNVVAIAKVARKRRIRPTDSTTSDPFRRAHAIEQSFKSGQHAHSILRGIDMYPVFVPENDIEACEFVDEDSVIGTLVESLECLIYTS